MLLLLLLRRRRDFLLLLPIVCFLLFQEDLLLQLFELGSVPGKKTLRIMRADCCVESDPKRLVSFLQLSEKQEDLYSTSSRPKMATVGLRA
ncbi:unnamed protein product [Boreogadus saida]